MQPVLDLKGHGLGAVPDQEIALFQQDILAVEVDVLTALEHGLYGQGLNAVGPDAGAGTGRATGVAGAFNDLQDRIVIMLDATEEVRRHRFIHFPATIGLVQYARPGIEPVTLRQSICRPGIDERLCNIIAHCPL